MLQGQRDRNRSTGLANSLEVVNDLLLLGLAITRVTTGRSPTALHTKPRVSRGRSVKELEQALASVLLEALLVDERDAESRSVERSHVRTAENTARVEVPLAFQGLDGEIDKGVHLELAHATKVVDEEDGGILLVEGGVSAVLVVGIE